MAAEEGVVVGQPEAAGQEGPFSRRQAVDGLTEVGSAHTDAEHLHHHIALARCRLRHVGEARAAGHAG
jgi:hypothetical protein